MSTLAVKMDSHAVDVSVDDNALHFVLAVTVLKKGSGSGLTFHRLVIVRDLGDLTGKWGVRQHKLASDSW